MAVKAVKLSSQSSQAVKVVDCIYSTYLCLFITTLNYYICFPIIVYSDRHKLEELHEIDELTGLNKSQEEEAEQLVERNPNLIREIEEEEARRPSAQNKGGCHVIFAT